MKVYGAMMLVVGLGLAGCGLFTRIEEPGVHVQSVTLADQSEHGARVLVTLIHTMEQRDVKHGVAALCLGGGNAVAVCIKR